MYDIDRDCSMILKTLAKRDNLSCCDIALLLSIDELNVADKLFYLFSNDFIETDSNIKPGEPIGLKTPFSISIKGRACLEYIFKDSWRFRIPVIISVIAIIISIISLRLSI